MILSCNTAVYAKSYDYIIIILLMILSCNPVVHVINYNYIVIILLI